MAHIAACLADSDGETSSLRSYIANALSRTSTDSLASTGSSEERKPFARRMQQTGESRKYQLFPKEKQPPQSCNIAKQLEPDQALTMSTGQTQDKSEKPSVSNGLRMRIKEHNLTRRRKISVPELGPMTTVHEVPMDSPTIPGRPPALHERSISSPVHNTWRQNHIAESMSCTKDMPDENGDMSFPSRPATSQKQYATSPLRQPLSPKDLAPLTIPSHGETIPRLARQLSLSRLRGNSQREAPAKTARNDDSPKTHTPYTPYTPYSAASSTTPRSATTAATASTLPTPTSATADSRQSPRPWEKPSGNAVAATPSHSDVDLMSTPKADTEGISHKRNQSDSGSIMERGRPRKRTDGTPVGHCRAGSKSSISGDRRAFVTLPKGWKSSEAVKHMDRTEATYLQKQALGQALRFEVLKKDDVENLSKELRHLDERTEYLRRTYTSLRAGRRNLHTRICQYLRSPRVAKFSYDSMLKQEETLAELDASIDDWIAKLEHAENRRTRVRQKLLEHVAAASTLSVEADLSGVSETLHHAMGVGMPQGPPDVSTPPRSPIKSINSSCYSQSPSPSPTPSASPQRVVARVPSVIPELPSEEADEPLPNRKRQSSSADSTLQRMESIRIYADSDVYALLADVESEFTKLNGDGVTSPELSPRRSDEERRVLHRNHSHDLLVSSSSSNSLDKTPPESPPAPAPPMKNDKNDTLPTSPPAPTPPMKDSRADDGDIFLTPAVFQPQSINVGA